ncbi:MAG: enolase C-terminal domain-like protein [Syntrophales bacterium]|nr:enolase C-terminal domain-like protein [Syntrophales bacterium]MDD5533122.1 enolase C-terminal domain-like protein [Syntrophales bacterium]
MKIKNIRLLHCLAPFVFGFHSPHLFRDRADSVIIEIEFDNGIIGYGESAPRSYVTGETCSLVARHIREFCIGMLHGCELASLSDIKRVLDGLEKELIRKAGMSYHSALGALDIALMDALGKQLKKPVHELIGPVVRTDIPHAASIPILTREKFETIMNKFRDFLFSSIKVVMSPDEEDNLKRVNMVRDFFGDGMDIRVEANGKWSREQAHSNLNRLREVGITAVEQPLSPGDLDGMREIRNRTGLLVIADESLSTISDARRLAESGACDILNIKISKCGGLIRSRQIADFASTRGLRCQLGSHVGETEVLSEAGMHFAKILENLTFFEGCSHYFFEKFWEGGRPKLKEETGNSNFGLGIDPQYRDFLDKYAVPC